MADSIFRKESIKKVTSPEQLNDYIKVSTPGIWLIIAAAAALLIALLVWAAFGTLDNTASVQGIADGNTVVCYVPSVSGIAVGQKVTVGESSGTVRSISEKPISYEQVCRQSGADEYTLYCMAPGDWSYVVELDIAGALPQGELVHAEIVTEKISPLAFILG